MEDFMRLPEHFLIGAATAAHQVEGNNIRSDLWAMEHMKHTSFLEPSLDAVDHYHRYEEDIKLLSDAGLNAYRFRSNGRASSRRRACLMQGPSHITTTSSPAAKIRCGTVCYPASFFQPEMADDQRRMGSFDYACRLCPLCSLYYGRTRQRTALCMHHQRGKYGHSGRRNRRALQAADDGADAGSTDSAKERRQRGRYGAGRHQS